ncbi:hypothetical protein [Bacillus salacetis]|uniref:hypothetical protein n=1 Tax=Bacillus salacetis TaxID=2315464 RepID=UPI001443B7A0|nr:hypothetical protein [Bacillus salacetis]
MGFMPVSLLRILIVSLLAGRQVVSGKIRVSETIGKPLILEERLVFIMAETVPI